MLDISHALKNPGQIYPLKAEVELPDMEIMGENLSFENACVEGELLGAGENVSVKGMVRADVLAHCARCLSPVRYPAETKVNETFVRAENAGADSDAYLIVGTEIGLEDLAKDAIVLDLPMRFLCSEDCLGLCPKCGGNRNERSCTCLEGDDDNPFAAIRDLFSK